MANRQPLQEPTLAGLTMPFTGPVFIELTARRFEHGRVDQGGNGNLDPFVARCSNARGRSRRWFQVSPDGSQARPRRQKVGAPESGASHIGGIVQHAADRGRIPICRAAPGPTAHLLQPPTRLAQAQPILADPQEDETDHVRLIFHDFEARHPAALSAAHVAITEGSARQRADRA